MPAHLDPDIRAVRRELRAALERSGLTQADFARALGTSGSRFSTYLAGTTAPSAPFFLRAGRLSLALQHTAARGLMSAPATARALRGHLRVQETEWAWRMLLQGRDHLRLVLASDDDGLVPSWEAAPTATGSAGFDALLAGLTRQEFEAAARPAPDWARAEPLAQPWVPEHPFLTAERVVAQTPRWLRDLNIFVPERDLVTA